MMHSFFFLQEKIITVQACAGKVNNITIDKCTKVGVLFKVHLWTNKHILPGHSCRFFNLSCIVVIYQGVVAACEIVNCSSAEVQCEVDFLTNT